MRSWHLSLCLAVALSQLGVVFGHSGRTDSRGGHYNRKTGEYHFHNSGSRGGSSYSYSRRMRTIRPRYKPDPAVGAVFVRGYYNRNGTYVEPHYRSRPDGNFDNNWSTKGNVNPYTGRPGTKVSPPSSSVTGAGTKQSVPEFPEPYTYSPGFYRKNGTLVRYKDLSTSDRRQHEAEVLARLGHKVDWQEHTLAEMQSMEYRILQAENLADLGLEVAWQDHSLAEMQDMAKRITTADSIAHLGIELDWKDHTSAELKDRLERIWLAQQLDSKYGHKFEWQEHNLEHLEAIENRIKLARFIAKTYGYRIEWNKHTLAEIQDIRSRIIMAKNLGRKVNWQKHSLAELQGMER